MTKTEQLAERFKIVYKKRKLQIDNLPITGPKGGSNARYIPEWFKHGNHVITKACLLAGIPTLNYWSGSKPTPSQSIPICIWPELEKLYLEVFKK